MDQINATTTENEWINQTAMERDTGACPPGSETYRVQRGDSFYLIARKFGVSVRALMNANPNIAAGHLLVGDILCVPVGEGRSCPVGSSAYTVRPGQSVVDVMLSSNVSLRALREYNEDIRLTALRPGDVLVVLEAMKMEIEVSAPVDGTVKAVSATVGSTVNTDDLLVTLG